MFYSISIKVDTNNGNCLTEISKISLEDLEKFKPLIKLIDEFEPYISTELESNIKWTHAHNFPVGAALRDDLGEKSVFELYRQIPKEIIEEFLELCPYGEYGFHTIEKISIVPSQEEMILLGR